MYKFVAGEVVKVKSTGDVATVVKPGLMISKVSLDDLDDNVVIKIRNKDLVPYFGDSSLIWVI